MRIDTTADRVPGGLIGLAIVGLHGQSKESGRGRGRLKQRRSLRSMRVPCRSGIHIPGYHRFLNLVRPCPYNVVQRAICCKDRTSGLLTG